MAMLAAQGSPHCFEIGAVSAAREVVEIEGTPFMTRLHQSAEPAHLRLPDQIRRGFFFVHRSAQ
jgi:hypothetical protein